MTRYEQEIADFTTWLESRLQGKALEVTQDEWNRGVDFLPQPYRSIVADGFNLWLEDRGYELSYAQTCMAFIRAIRNVGELRIIPNTAER